MDTKKQQSKYNYFAAFVFYKLNFPRKKLAYSITNFLFNKLKP